MSAKNPIRAAVVGLGAMGRNHIRVLSELPGVELVAGVDPTEASHKLIARYALKTFTDYAKMLAEVRPNLVVIAVPTDFHREVACAAMAAGAHVLVEKPIAPSLDDADAMIASASKNGVKLMVGHLERFNPVVQEMKKRVNAGEIGRIFQLHARRLSPFPSRIQDVGVILDLATHDIDAMHFITGSRAIRAFAEVAQAAHKTCEDMLCGVLRFESGPIGLLDVSWLSPWKLRELSVVGEGGMYVADYLTQDLRWYKNGAVNTTWEPATHFSGAVEGDMIKTYIPKKEPLRAEHEAFVKAIQEDLPSPVTGEDGKQAIAVALNLIRAGKESVLINT
jgi:UDP-N-acetylglucosamine 3-dehydrogenase